MCLEEIGDYSPPTQDSFSLLAVNCHKLLAKDTRVFCHCLLHGFEYSPSLRLVAMPTLLFVSYLGRRKDDSMPFQRALVQKWTDQVQMDFELSSPIPLPMHITVTLICGFLLIKIIDLFLWIPDIKHFTVYNLYKEIVQKFFFSS